MHSRYTKWVDSVEAWMWEESSVNRCWVDQLPGKSSRMAGWQWEVIFALVGCEHFLFFYTKLSSQELALRF